MFQEENLKDYLSRALADLCLVEQNHLCNFSRGYNGEPSFEVILYLCSVEWNHLCNFGREYHEDQFCEIILN